MSKTKFNVQTAFDDFTGKWCKGSDKEEYKDALVSMFYNINKNNDKNYFNEKFNDLYENLMKENKEIKDILNELIKKSEVIQKTSTKKSLGNFASAAAKKLAEDNGINELDIESSGKDGKILLKDVKVHVEPSKGKPVTKKSSKKTALKGKIATTKTIHSCKGVLQKSGKPCSRNGTTKASDGNWYCHSHIVDYKDKADTAKETDIESIGEGDIEIKKSDNKNNTHSHGENSDGENSEGENSDGENSDGENSDGENSDENIQKSDNSQKSDSDSEHYDD